MELPEEIQQYKLAGEFTKAQKAIKRWMEKPIAESLKVRLRYEQYILEELPKEFPYTKEEIIELFQEKIPNFSDKDLKRIEEENLAEWIYLNGEKHYIHNLLRNICDKDEEIQERLGIYGKLTEDKRLLLAKVRELQEKKTVTEKIHLRTSIRLKDEVFQPGMKIKVHLPLPAQWYQTSEIEILDHAAGKVTIDDERSRYRSICFEDTLKENRTFYVEYQYKVQADYIDLWEKTVKFRKEKAKTGS